MTPSPPSSAPPSSALPSSALPSSAPETQGIPSAAVQAFVDALDERVDAPHGFQLLRHGHVVAEGWWHPYAPERPHQLYSVSKSFTSTAIGLAVADGLLTVDDPVLPFFADEAPAEPSPNLAAMRVRHLLTMTTGHSADTVDRLGDTRDGNWVRAFLAQPVAHEPGTQFVYNSGASYLLSAIVQRLTGATLLEYLRPRLLEPLGITDATWEGCPRGISLGGWGLSLRTAELARFGQLYLDGGVWQGRRLVPAEWVREATGKRVDNAVPDAPTDWRQGYGYQFWRCRHGAFRADGAFGQFCLLMPEQDAVLAMTAGLADMQEVLDLAWTHLLPAMAPGPLPADGAARKDLDARLSSLTLTPQRSTATAGHDIAGRTYVAADGAGSGHGRSRPGRVGSPRITTVAFTGGGVTVVDQDGPLAVACGDGAWAVADTGLGPVAGSAGWTGPDTYAVQVQYLETPFRRTFTFDFRDAGLTVTPRDNVGFGPLDHPPSELRRRGA